MSARVYVLAAGRTLIAPRGGALSNLDEAWLGAALAQALLKELKAKPEDLGALIVGNALAAGGNPARRVGLALGLGEETMCLSVDSQCCSGLDAIGLGMALIRSGSHSLVVAGGVESASNAPLRQWPSRDAQPGWQQAPFTPWPDNDPDMVMAALRLAEARGIDSTMQYNWAIQSHKLARQNKDRSLKTVLGLALEQDPHTRNLTLDTCHRAERVQPHNPTTMAPVADGAAFLILASEDYLEKIRTRGERPQTAVELCDHKAMAGDYEMPGLACGLLRSWLLSQLDAQGNQQGKLKVELMESFAAQAVANRNDLHLDSAEINAWGGMLSTGHPIGASGAVLAARLCHRLEPGESGLAVIPAAGGLASGLFARRLP